ncbi:MAG TPA: carboxypeptidase-like regulatory domain-containing protein [Candidatus Acidoferrales bacterium]|nr:carboxypeptidase-like regulatory domain-containing protein [Candidatus Acidoferrales bacterium]
MAQQTPTQQPPEQQTFSQQQLLPGSVSGTISDRDGNAISGAQVALTRDDNSPKQEAMSSDDGQFSFANVPPGPFHLTISAVPFAMQTYSGSLAPGQSYIVPQITMILATVTTVIRVEPVEVVAEHQIKAQEQQRVLGVVPNFYVSYVPNAAPLDRKQKAELSWKTAIDPVTFGLIGAIAGIQQATNDFSGYGQGAEGYGKRYGASYADYATGTLFGSVIFPSLLKQDPRYFYKGMGSKRSRIMYAIANSVICKGDNGHWQPNTSSILGNLVSGGISNLYYPPQNRSGVKLTFEVALVGVAATAADNLLQEFVVRKLTPSARKRESAALGSQ